MSTTPSSASARRPSRPRSSADSGSPATTGPWCSTWCQEARPEAAGIRPGDVIVTVADVAVRNVEDFVGALRDRRPGDRLGVEVLRDGDLRTVEVVLSERPAGPSS